MADTKTSLETLGGALDGTEDFRGAKAGANYRWRAAQFGAWVHSQEHKTPIAMTETTTGNHDLFRQTSGAGTAGGYSFGLSYNGGTELTNGPTVEPNYINDGWTLGLNSSGADIPIDATKPTFALQWESKFAQGGATDPFGSEFHIVHKGVGAAIAQRMWSSFMPHDLTTAAGKASHGTDIQANKLIFRDHTQAVFLQATHIPGSTYGQWSYAAGANLLFESNNLPMLKQKNAANSAYLNLPYFTSVDCLQGSIPGGLIFSGAPNTATRQFLNFQNTSALQAGDVFLNLEAGGFATPGGLTVIQNTSHTVNPLKTYFQQNNTSDATADIIHDNLLLATAKGDILYRVGTNGGTAWSWGLDTSDSNAFVVSNSNALGTTNKLALRTNGEAVIYNVTGTPATPAAGSYIIYCQAGVLKAMNSAGTPTTLAS